MPEGLLLLHPCALGQYRQRRLHDRDGTRLMLRRRSKTRPRPPHSASSAARKKASRGGDAHPRMARVRYQEPVDIGIASRLCDARFSSAWLPLIEPAVVADD